MLDPQFSPRFFEQRVHTIHRSQRGFSVNISEKASDLTRTNVERLNEVLGEKRFQLARNQEDIDRGQREGREGRQFYPLLVAVLAVVLGLELLMANRFYGKSD